MDKQLIFKTARKDLEKVLYDVKVVDIATYSKDNLFDGKYNGIKIPKYKALVNSQSKEVLCVVSEKYRVVDNKTALDMGLKAFEKLFPGINIKDIIPFKVITPQRLSFCHIDLIHKDVNFNDWKQDVWFPFLRVTNSYNRMFALTYELGFVKELCSNGMIFNKKTVKVKYIHTDDEMPLDIDVDISALKTIEKEFQNHLKQLNDISVSGKYVFQILCKALNLNFNFKVERNMFTERIKEDYLKLREMTYVLAEEYSEKYKDTATLMLNVMTDIVSHQEEYRNLTYFSLRANIYYRRISEWMSDFIVKAKSRDFNIEQYLGNYAAYNTLLD